MAKIVGAAQKAVMGGLDYEGFRWHTLSSVSRANRCIGYGALLKSMEVLERKGLVEVTFEDHYHGYMVRPTIKGWECE